MALLLATAVCVCSAVAPAVDKSILKQRRIGCNLEGAEHYIEARQAIWNNISATFSTVRFDVTWERVETVRGVYNFTLYDAMVARCLANDIVPYIILDYDNPIYGACPPGHCMCTTGAETAFLAYSREVIHRYKGKAVYELWNEPNGRHPRPHNMPAASYAALLTTLGRMFQNDSAVLLVAGATAGVDPGYIAALGEAALSYADAVSVHPYTGSCGGPEIFHDKNAWQSGLFTKLRNVVGGKPILATEVGWSTCAQTKNISASVVCAAYPGSEDTLDDQAIYLARQWLLSCLDRTPFTFVYQYANGELNPANNSDIHPEIHNASDGGANYGLNWNLDGPPKPAMVATTAFRKAVGQRDFIRRITPEIAHGATAQTTPVTAAGRETRKGPEDADDFTFVLGFGNDHPTGTIPLHTATGRSTAAVTLYAVWSLKMDGAEKMLVGTGNMTACPGVLAQPLLEGTPAPAAACEAACRNAPRCRSFAVWPKANTSAGICTLFGSRCLTPYIDVTDCGGSHCADAQAFTLRQTKLQNVTFDVSNTASEQGGENRRQVAAAWFSAIDVYGVEKGKCCEDTATGLLTVEVGEAPLYLKLLT